MIRTVKSQPKLEAAGGVSVHSQSVLRHHGLRGCRERKKPLLRTQHLKAPLKFAADHVDREKTLWRRTLRSDETKSLATVSSSMFRGEKVRPLTTRTPCAGETSLPK